MDWIVTTARTVEEAQTRALDLLGVDAADAEVQVVEEGRTGLFGRTKVEARVRARIKPKAAPAKEERRGRNDGRNRNRSKGGGNRSNNKSGRSGSGSSKSSGGNSGGGGKGGDGGSRDANNKGSGSGSSRNRNRNRRRGRGGGGGGGGAAAGAAAATGGGSRNDRNDRSGGDRNDRPEMPVDEQRSTLEEFVQGVAVQFDPAAKVELTEEGTTLTASVTGEDVGRLVGPKASVLQALEELARTAMHRAANGRRYHRIRVDVDSYRARRREALERFARDSAERVRESGQPLAMEPMGAADRKVVHDVVNDMDGVESGSEGRDPRRYIVISPVGGAAMVDEEE